MQLATKAPAQELSELEVEEESPQPQEQEPQSAGEAQQVPSLVQCICSSAIKPLGCKF